MRIWLRETRRGRVSFQVLQEFIVAAAKANPCGFFLTEDFRTGQNVDELLVVNPFKTQPKQI